MKLTVLVFLLSAISTGVTGQDSAYYKIYNRQITGRLILSHKFTGLRILRGDERFKYRPVTTYNAGIGFTYEWLTVNLGYGIGWINPNTDRDNTRSLDLQFHAYGRRIIVDALGQFYKGYRLSGTEEVRKDIRANAVGATAQYLLNADRFSYRAAFLQSEWQQRSAGSWLLGFNMYGGNVRSDSAIVPRANGEPAVERTTFFQTGPSAGYAYSYVYKKHFFATASASLSLDLSVLTISDGQQEKASDRCKP